jgi:hypothetical protein
MAIKPGLDSPAQRFSAMTATGCSSGADYQRNRGASRIHKKILTVCSVIIIPDFED